MIAWLLLACGSTESPPERPDPRTMEGATYMPFEPAVIVASGSPCRVERVPLDGLSRTLVFEAEGACPVHCAFERRFAVCAEGRKLVRHLYGGPALTLVDAPWVEHVQRVFIVADGTPHTLSITDGMLREHVVSVQGSTVAREQPVDTAGIRAWPLELSKKAYDLDSVQTDCPSGLCQGLGQPGPAAFASFRGRHPELDADGRMLMPDRPFFLGEKDGQDVGPLEVCGDADCATFEEVPFTAPSSVSLMPPFLLIEPEQGPARVFGLDAEPDLDLGEVSWATFLPIQIELPR